MGIKEFIMGFINICSRPEPIRGPEDYRRVKAWVRKVTMLYAAFTMIALIATPIAITIATNFGGVPRGFAVMLFPILILVTCWGYATVITYLPQILNVNQIMSFGKVGYVAGRQFKTRHVDVTHEFGNTYTVSSYTTNKGCLFAAVAVLIRFFVWLFFCIYIGTFLNFKKLHESRRNLGRRRM